MSKDNCLHEYDSLLLRMKNSISDSHQWRFNYRFVELLTKPLREKYNLWYRSPHYKDTHGIVDEFLILASEAINEE